MKQIHGGKVLAFTNLSKLVAKKDYNSQVEGDLLTIH